MWVEFVASLDETRHLATEKILGPAAYYYREIQHITKYVLHVLSVFTVSRNPGSATSG